MQSAATPPPAETAECLSAFMPVPDAATAIGKSREYLYRRLREGRIPGAKFGRSRVIRRRFVVGFLAENAAGRFIDFEDYAAQWHAREAQAVAS